jgi:hypothetical protein
MSRITAGLLLLCLCCACSKPKPPPTDEPPEPQAEANTELRDAIQAPIERAKAVEQTVQEAADKRRVEIDAQN